jgi:hypothetical protein
MFGLPAGGTICAAVLNGIREVSVNSMIFVPGFQV